jgi:hypothetical protein
MHNSSIQNIGFFMEQSEDFLTTFVPLMQYSCYPARCLIYKVNHYADKVYFISKGKVNFIHTAINLKFRTMI